MTDRELMQQALHTLEGWANHGKWVWPESALEQAKRNTTESITALRERLARPNEFEPDWDQVEALQESLREHMAEIHRLREWQGLTDEEKAELDAKYGDDMLAHLDAVEAKLKEKNR